MNTANRANTIRSLADQLSPLHISVSNNNNAQFSQPSPETSKSQSPRIKCDQQKWNCNHCTYENYPKSLNCVLCGSKRGRGSPRNSPELSSSMNPSVLADRRRESPSPEGAHYSTNHSSVLSQTTEMASCSTSDAGAAAPRYG